MPNKFWFPPVEHPFREALQGVMGGLEPPSFVRGYSSEGYSDKENALLQEWVLENIGATALYWSTGIGIIEAAELIVSEAVANANIPPVGHDA